VFLSLLVTGEYKELKETLFGGLIFILFFLRMKTFISYITVLLFFQANNS